MLDIDPAGVGAFQITKKLLEGRWLLEGIIEFLASLAGIHAVHVCGVRFVVRHCNVAWVWAGKSHPECQLTFSAIVFAWFPCCRQFVPMCC
jgi:hypothetical protein